MKTMTHLLAMAMMTRWTPLALAALALLLVALAEKLLQLHLDGHLNKMRWNHQVLRIPKLLCS